MVSDVRFPYTIRSLTRHCSRPCCVVHCHDRSNSAGAVGYGPVGLGALCFESQRTGSPGVLHTYSQPVGKERTSVVSTPSLAELYRFAMNFFLVRKRKR